MKKVKRLQKLYNQCLKTGKLPKQGLCRTLKDYRIGLQFKRLQPTRDDMMNLNLLYKSQAYWASDLNLTDSNKYRKFTPLRQTLLLLLIELCKDAAKK